MRHTIIKDMCLHLLDTHFSIKEKDVNFSCSELDNIVPDESKFLQLVADFDALAKKLKALQLPLHIRDVLATSAALRYTAPCVPEPLARSGLKNGQTYIPLIKGVIRFESSAAWPTDDEEAIQKVKTALFVKLSETLHSTYMIDSFPYDDHIEVVFKGMVYSLIVHHPREITLYRAIDPARAAEMDRECVQAPLHHVAVHGTAVKYHAFTKAVRLAKRWVNAHFFSDHISDETVELLMTSCFTAHYPENVPQMHIVAFYRFLELIANFDATDFPALVIADFDRDFRSVDFKTAVGQRKYAKENRSSEDDSLFVTTSYARGRNVWKAPSAVVMRRMIAFAKKSAEMTKALIMSPKRMTSADWQGIFNHDLNDYDVIVTLDPYRVPTLPLALPWQASAAALAKLAARESAALKRARKMEESAEELKNPPLAGFDPCTLLCESLRRVYGDKALFFRNALGGEHVGVVWRPGALAERKWSVKDMLSVMPVLTSEKVNEKDKKKKMTKKGKGEDCLVRINVPEFMRDVEIMGSGLVKSVSVNEK